MRAVKGDASECAGSVPAYATKREAMRDEARDETRGKVYPKKFGGLCGTRSACDPR
jgi:hypothetical protein